MTGRALSRRAALLPLLGAPLALGGCQLFSDLFGDTKKPLEGTRQTVLTAARGMQVDNPDSRKIVLPPASPNPAWPQAGGGPSHLMGHPAVRETLAEAWTANIGAGGGYRRKITARPVVGDGRVFAMDSEGAVSAFDVKAGGRLWRFDPTAGRDDLTTTNIGGGIALDAGTLYAASGLAEVLALDAATGKPRWRKPLPTAARSAPTIADGRLYIPTLDGALVALAAADGAKLWTYQAAPAETAMLGLPAPAFSDGLLVAGFGSGDLACLRAASGGVTWTDSLASVRGRNSLVDLSAIRGLPVIDEGQVYAVGLGGLLVSVDLRSGRRLWERDLASSETPWLAGDWLFVLTDDQALVAVNRTDGAIAWIMQLDRWENPEKQRDPIRWVGPTLAGDRLVVASSTKQVLAVSPYTGKSLGARDIPAAASLAPVVAQSTLFMVTDDGTLLALR